MGRTPGRRIQHSVLDKPRKHLQDRTTRGASSPPRLRKAETGGFSNGAESANPRYPRRQSRRMVPIPGDGDGRGILGGQPDPLVSTHRSKSTNSPVRSNSKMSNNKRVSKRARLLDLPGIESRVELNTYLDETPGGVNFSQANLFNLQPSANLSVNDNMHNSTDPVCDVPVDDITNPELSRNSLMNFRKPDLPETQSANTHSPSLRSSTSHSESGGGVIRHDLDPSLSNYEVLCEQLFERIKKLLVLDEATNSPEKRENMHLHMHNELLWKGNLLYIPVDSDLRNDLLYWHHDVPWCGHLGVEKTVNLIRRAFHWPSITKDVNTYIQTCFTCQSNKPDRRVRRPP